VLFALPTDIAAAATAKLPRGYDQPCGFGKYYAEREKPPPLLDHPLRQPSICRGPDSVYYLTGTDGTPAVAASGKIDFANNDGIRVWKSENLQDWEPLGTVFDIVTWSAKENLNQPWWRYPAVNPDQPLVEDELQTVLDGISVERRLRGLPAEERLRGLSAEEVLRRFTPEQVAGGLSDEQAARLQELLERRQGR
jgi:hypothetical protein